jgi:hypothetical protein
MRVHNDEHRFVPGTRQASGFQFGGVAGTYIPPTLTEQGIDVDEFIRENHSLIENLRKGTR